ncbi:MAG: hypothetical protein ACKO2P_10750 [Planctomycetota bacterium]
MQLAYAHLNLRRNPFGALTTADAQAVAEVNLTEAIDFLRQPPASGRHSRPPVLQLMGRQGSGKTTHLLALLAAFPGAVYSPIPIGQSPRIRTDGDPILVDDAQWLTWALRRRLFRSHRRLVLGTHRDYATELRHCHRPLLTLSSETTRDPETLCRRLNARIEAARRGPGAVPIVSLHTATQAWNHHGADLRSVMERLFHIFQSLNSPDEPWFLE